VIQLTNRQSQVLSLIAEGNSVKQIGYQLGISAKTVDCHKTRLMRRLKLHCTADLVRYQLSVVESPPGAADWLIKRVREMEAEMEAEIRREFRIG
jgi:DNA-binding CsgD family transcriptional regulator